MHSTTNLFWDCECEKFYIHSAKEQKCSICEAERIEQPDSLVFEIGKPNVMYSKRKKEKR